MRRKNGTPAQRQLSISHCSATNVSVSESGGDARLVAVAEVLAAHDVVRFDRPHRAEDLVLLLADGPRLERRRRFHRHEGEHLEQVGDDHVAVRAGRLVEADAAVEAERLGHVDLHVVDVSRFQIGSNRPLANRKARMFCAASLPRKWSMRKICSSANISCT